MRTNNKDVKQNTILESELLAMVAKKLKNKVLFAESIADAKAILATIKPNDLKFH